MKPPGEIVTRAKFKQQLAVVAHKTRLHRIDKRVVLSVGGLATAEMPHKAPVVALPTYELNGGYYKGEIVQLRLDALTNQVVLIGDEASNRGRLLVDVARSIKKPPADESRLYGEEALTYAFIARNNEIEPGVKPILPDFYGELCKGKPPKPYWEFEHLRRIPEARKIAQEIERLDFAARPTALLAVGSCLTAAAELAKRLGISGRYVGGLPADENGMPDMSWAYVGDCENRTVLVLGAAGARLDSVIREVGKTGVPLPYILPVSQ